MNGSETAILQSKVEFDKQGRVFSAVNFISWLTNPISPIIAGLLADQLLEPFMLTNGAFAKALGFLFGNIHGSGMSVLITVCGICAAFVGLAGYLFKPLHQLEDELPDWDSTKVDVELTSFT